MISATLGWKNADCLEYFQVAASDGLAPVILDKGFLPYNPGRRDDAYRGFHTPPFSVDQRKGLPKLMYSNTASDEGFDFKAAFIGILFEMELYIWRLWIHIWCHNLNIWHQPGRPVTSSYI